MVVRCVLLDIEGTTTPITFVTETLFPYVRRELSSYLKNRWDEEDVKNDIISLREQSIKDQSDNSISVCEIINTENKEEIIESICNNVKQQMDIDRKITPLKQLQGHMWKFGYQSGELKGDLYEDVLPAFKKWKENNIPIYIYSSGSVAAQKLLFGNSVHGNLLSYISGHFDTNIGLKVEHESYINIAKELNVKENEILFVTDSYKELLAANKANLTLRLSIRPGNAPVDSDEFKAIYSFDELFKDIEYSG